MASPIEQTDHGHLGQLLTYTAGTDAKKIVWVARAFREEHRVALDWLNANTGEDVRFFGVVDQGAKRRRLAGRRRPSRSSQSRTDWQKGPGKVLDQSEEQQAEVGEWFGRSLLEFRKAFEQVAPALDDATA